MTQVRSIGICEELEYKGLEKAEPIALSHWRFLIGSLQTASHGLMPTSVNGRWMARWL